jgi:cell wall-associated NlpC family hydrolase
MSRPGLSNLPAPADTPVAPVRRLLLLPLVLAAAIASGCASSAAVPRPFPQPGESGPPAASVHRPDRTAAALQKTALGLTGTPYRTGGTSPAGFDCSGFVWYVFDRQGVELPRTVAAQFHAGRAVRRARLQPGDLVFFDTEGRPASHVGILVGDDEFVHAPSSRGRVRVERLTSPYWARRYVGARRVF